jgi:hypothetical protein
MCPVETDEETDRTFFDYSGPLCNMYSKTTEEEDNKMADRWQKDAYGILIFVSPYISLHAGAAATNTNTLDWFILHCRRGIRLGLDSGPKAKFTRYLCILSLQHLSTSRRPKHISNIHTCHSS